MPVQFADSSNAASGGSGGDAPHTPSMLFLTQNIGGLADTPNTTASSFASPSPSSSSPLCDPPLTEEAKTRVEEFVCSLREWVHKAAYYQRERRVGRAEGAPWEAEAAGAAAALRGYTLASRPPQLDVIVLHLQEVGGKRRWPAFSAYLDAALRERLLPECGWCSGLLMDDGAGGDAVVSATTIGSGGGGNNASSAGVASGGGAPPSAHRFTAVATFIVLSPRVCPIASVLSLPQRAYVSVLDDPRTYGASPRNIYHAAKFSAAGKSRKGFVLVSLRLGTAVVNVCNVHLYHDEDNVIALDAASADTYAARRRDALLETLAECAAALPSLTTDALLVFGDYNVRMHGANLSAELRASHGVALQPTRKDLNAAAGMWGLFTRPALVQQWRRRFDHEPAALMAAVAAQDLGPGGGGLALAELPVRFPPTYSRLPVGLGAVRDARSDAFAAAEGGGGAPENEEEAEAEEEETYGEGVALVSRRSRPYQTSRVPAWCDRVWFNPAALELLAGGRGAPPPADGSASAANSGGGGVYNDTSGGGEENKRLRALLQQTGLPQPAPACLYESTVLAYTDHDAVFLLV